MAATALLAACSGGSGAGAVAIAATPESASTDPDPWGDDFSGEALAAYPYSMSIVQMQKGGPDAPLGTVNLGGGQLGLMPDPATIGLAALFSVNRHPRDFRVADFNGDGVPDIVANVYNDNPLACATADSMALLFVQNPGANGNGDGTFTEQTSFRNFAIRGRGETIITADFFNTGALDIFFPQYAFAYSAGCPDQPHSFLLHNDGAGGFTDISTSAGVALPAGSWVGGVCPQSGDSADDCFRPEGAQAVDFDGDGKIDFYVASHLFINNGDGTFTDKRAAFGLPIVRDEGAKFLDWNNDGKLDLLVNDDRYGPTLFQFDGTRFLQMPRTMADGTPFFSDDGKAVDFGPNDYSFGVNIYDIDNDGLEDVLIDGGSSCQNMIFHNTGKNFVRVHPPAAPNGALSFFGLGNGNGAMAFGDINGDGLADIAYSTGGALTCESNSDQLEFFTNTSTSTNPAIRIEVLGPNGERNQQGRVVRVSPQSAPATIFTRIVDSGSGFLAQNAYPILIGTPYAGLHNVRVGFALGEVDLTIMPGQSATVYAPSATVPGHYTLDTIRPAAVVPAVTATLTHLQN